MVWYGMIWYGMVWYGMTMQCVVRIRVFMILSTACSRVFVHLSARTGREQSQALRHRSHQSDPQGCLSTIMAYGMVLG